MAAGHYLPLANALATAVPEPATLGLLLLGGALGIWMRRHWSRRAVRDVR